MEIDYIIGSKEDFFKFLDSIGLYDKVAVLTHTDLDGLSSGLFIEMILEARGVKVDYMDFLEIKPNMVKEVFAELKEKRITKVIFCDLNVEAIDYEGFEELRFDKDVFLIDHHPTDERLKDKSGVLKTVSEDSSGMVTFVLGEGYIDSKEWGWLVCASIFADYAFRSEKNFNFLRSFYPEVEKDSISSSVPGINARRISSALIYYKNDISYVYRLVKEKNLDELMDIHKLIEDEVYRIVDDFEEKKKYFPDKDIYFYEIKSPFDVLSYVATMIAGSDMEGNFLFMHRLNDRVRFSARSPGSKIDMGKLMGEGVEGFEDADGGGHIPAAGAGVRLGDEEIFLNRVLGESWSDKT